MRLALVVDMVEAELGIGLKFRQFVNYDTAPEHHQKVQTIIAAIIAGTTYGRSYFKS
ncbi:hypothetical protein JK217_13300 [Gluconobacter kondonii]|uniref:hypothetical protein n=1 Tax=Gluconobacter kondonii TaxID=941463 RepID=UPI001B8CC9CE|nr:hypothetical protein [Gluconobacter kondonii]MBS1078707.1 hypothetical protein [Gluconobacter kondonii]